MDSDDNFVMSVNAFQLEDLDVQHSWCEIFGLYLIFPVTPTTYPYALQNLWRMI